MPSHRIVSIEPAIEMSFPISLTLKNQLNYFVIGKSAENVAPNEFEIDLNEIAR